jgi:hypothetical protein
MDPIGIIAVVIASLIASALRLGDTPIGPFDAKAMVSQFVWSLVAAFLAVWGLGLDPVSYIGFVGTIAAAIAGQAGVRALLNAMNVKAV